MAVTHLFPNKAVPNAIGQKLLALVGSTVIFDLKDFVENLSNAASFSGNWDFGDGTRANGTTAASASHAFASPGEYPVSLQAVVDGRLLTYSWTVQVVAQRLLFESTVSIPWTAGAQTTFTDETGRRRHALIILPKLCAAVATEAIGSWGTPTALAPTADLLAAACDNLALRLQNAYAASLGWLEVPSAPLEQGVYAHFANDALAVGTSDTLVDKLSLIESAWREVARGAAQGHRWPAVANAVGDLQAGVSSLAALVPLGWEGGSTYYVAAGEKSVRAAAVRQWVEYACREAADEKLLTTLEVWRWRQLAAQYVGNPPQFDPGQLLAWEASQLGIQAVYGFYQALGNANAIVNAVILVLIDPETRQVSLRLYNETANLWAVAQAGFGADATAKPELPDMLLEQGPSSGNWVGARAVGACNTSGPMPWPWDLRRLQSLFEAKQRADAPQFSAIGSAVIERYADKQGLSVTERVQQDGATRRSVSLVSPTYLAADVIRPAIAADAYAALRGGMRPHAAMNHWIDAGSTALHSAFSGLPASPAGMLADVAKLMK